MKPEDAIAYLEEADPDHLELEPRELVLLVVNLLVDLCPLTQPADHEEMRRLKAVELENNRQSPA